jgi:hypothetical protein
VWESKISTSCDVGKSDIQKNGEILECLVLLAGFIALFIYGKAVKCQLVCLT